MDEGAGMQDCVHQAAGDSSPALRAAIVGAPLGYRGQFETFYRHSRSGKGAKNLTRKLERLADDTYADESVQRHWWTWQNAWRACTASLHPFQFDATPQPLQSQGREVPTGQSAGVELLNRVQSTLTLVRTFMPRDGAKLEDIWLRVERDEKALRTHLATGTSVPSEDAQRLRIRCDSAGNVDEVLAQAAELHIEQMNDGHWWMGITDATGELWHVNFSTKRNAKINCLIESYGVHTGQSLPSEARPEGALASSGPDEPTPASLLKKKMAAVSVELRQRMGRE